MLVPWNSKPLIAANKATTGAAASPFVVAIILSGIPALPYVALTSSLSHWRRHIILTTNSAILNAAILVFVFSAANSDLYIASRTLYGLAHEGKAPRIFKWTDKRGVPVPALGLSCCFCLLAYLAVNQSSYTVFGYFVNLVTMFGLLTWISILIAHIFFVRARKAQNIPDSALAYVAPLGMWGSVGALIFSILIMFFKGFALFCYKKTASKGTRPVFDTSTFVTTYLGLPLYIVLFFGYKIIMKTKLIRPEDADLYSGKARIDAEEAEFLAAQAEKKGGPETKVERIYRLTLGNLF